VLPPAGSLMVGAGVEGVVSPEGTVAPPAGGVPGVGGASGLPVGGVAGIVEPSGLPVGGVAGMVVAPSGLPVGGVAGMVVEPSGLPLAGGVVDAGVVPVDPAPPAQREFKGDRSQRIFMIAGDRGFSEGVDWAKLRVLMVVRANPAAIKLKIVFAVVFIGNIPNSS
jgi:hypothetical protein